MNEKLDLTKILKNCPKGWKFYTSVWGEVEFIEYNRESGDFIFDPIDMGNMDNVHINTDGTFCCFGECIIFPSKEQRDWSKFTAPWYKKEIENKFHVGQYVTNGHTGGQNDKTNSLENLVKPKFKVGDRIRHKETNKHDVYEISKVYDDSYGITGFTWMIYMKYQDQYELVLNKFNPHIH